MASVTDTNLQNASDVDVVASGSTANFAISGSVAISTNKNKAVGIAGAVTVNVQDSATHAFIERATLTNVGDVSVLANADGSIFAVAAGLGGAPRGFGVAGSVAINLITSDTQAYMDASSVIGESLAVHSRDKTSIIAVGGAIAFGGKAGIGVGFAYNQISGGATALLSATHVDVSGLLSVTATNSAQITGVAAAIAVAVAGFEESSPTAEGSEANERNTYAVAVAAGVSINRIKSDSHASIESSGTSETRSTAGSVVVKADDDQLRINGVAGGVAISVSKGKSTGKSTSVAAGISVVFNEVERTTDALVDNSYLTVEGDVDVTASSNAVIFSLAIAGSVSVAVSGRGNTAFAGAGSIAVNTIRGGGVRSRVRRSDIKNANTSGSAKISAIDKSAITAIAGGLAVAVSGGNGNDASTSVAIGAAVAFNTIIDGGAAAYSEDSKLKALDHVEVSATLDAEIYSFSLAGAAAIGQSGGGGGYAVSGAGAFSRNQVTGSSEAYIKKGSVVAGKDIKIEAKNESKLEAHTVGFSVAVGASSKKTAGALSIGLSLGYNFNATDVLAYISDDADVSSTSGNLTVSATNKVDIDTTVVAASVAAGYSGSDKALALSGGGAIAENRISGKTNAYVESSTVISGSDATSGSDLTISASNDASTIDAAVIAAALSAAISPAKSAGSAGIGFSIARNLIGDSADFAILDGSGGNQGRGSGLRDIQRVDSEGRFECDCQRQSANQRLGRGWCRSHCLWRHRESAVDRRIGCGDGKQDRNDH